MKARRVARMHQDLGSERDREGMRERVDSFLQAIESEKRDSTFPLSCASSSFSSPLMSSSPSSTSPVLTCTTQLIKEYPHANRQKLYHFVLKHIEKRAKEQVSQEDRARLKEILKEWYFSGTADALRNAPIPDAHLEKSATQPEQHPLSPRPSPSPHNYSVSQLASWVSTLPHLKITNRFALYDIVHKEMLKLERQNVSKRTKHLIRRVVMHEYAQAHTLQTYASSHQFIRHLCDILLPQVQESISRALLYEQVRLEHLKASSHNMSRAHKRKICRQIATLIAQCNVLDDSLTPLPRHERIRRVCEKLEHSSKFMPPNFSLPKLLLQNLVTAGFDKADRAQITGQHRFQIRQHFREHMRNNLEISTADNGQPESRSLSELASRIAPLLSPPIVRHRPVYEYLLQLSCRERSAKVTKQQREKVSTFLQDKLRSLGDNANSSGAEVALGGIPGLCDELLNRDDSLQQQLSRSAVSTLLRRELEKALRSQITDSQKKMVKQFLEEHGYFTVTTEEKRRLLDKLEEELDLSRRSIQYVVYYLERSMRRRRMGRSVISASKGVSSPGMSHPPTLSPNGGGGGIVHRQLRIHDYLEDNGYVKACFQDKRRIVDELQEKWPDLTRMRILKMIANWKKTRV
eukprot:CAMPEP_0117442678 /NCGR_PEP_ID=MMETSP0759-20121206/4281_1 /TAXON_ID=63605 /ORGANISM="Percolomonas cosmopolitus, Strain WS" /LENGTH=632 /DNA_ID=CAMNT_0005234585 /DNA_START=346 /DNA_END=2241 /DNA_ORIENTATION=+